MNNAESVENPKFLVFNLLRILKFFYSFKELERLLGVSSQVLWKYMTLRVIPEKETAQRLLARIRDGGLVEEAMARVLEGDSELWLLFSNPGILELAALRLVEEFKKSKVDVVMSVPDPYSTALAAIASAYLKTRLCIPSRTPYSDSVIAESYEVLPGLLDAVGVPRKCVPKDSRVLVVAVTTENPSRIKVAMDIVAKAHAKLVGVFSLIGSRQVLKHLLNPSQDSGVRTLILAEVSEGATNSKTPQ